MDPNIPTQPVVQPTSKKKLPQWLTTVTLFSKLLAMALFIALPFAGFYLGMKYQEKITVNVPIVSQVQKNVIPTPTLVPIDISNWKTYTRIVPADKTRDYNDPEFKITMQYPSDWTLKESHTLSNRVVDNPEEINTAEFTGKEGKITIEWGPMGFGGGCDQPYTILHIKNMAINVCHYISSNGTENWTRIDDINQNQPSEANATAGPPLSVNSPIIKTILSTLAFY